MGDRYAVLDKTGFHWVGTRNLATAFERRDWHNANWPGDAPFRVVKVIYEELPEPPKLPETLYIRLWDDGACRIVSLPITKTESTAVWRTVGVLQWEQVGDE